MPAGLGNTLLKAKKKKAEEARSKYRHAVEQAKANAPEPHPEDLVKKDTSSSKTLTSIWQTSNMDDFLHIATNRETGFAAERNVRVVVDGTAHVVNDTKIQPLSDSNKDWFSLSDNLKIPTRPEWSYDMSAEEIQGNEKRAFLDWRRALAQVEEKEQIVMTPYEKNLEVWRQLWRVVERSDVVLELVDARNPLAFRCQHFEKYVGEHENLKKMKKSVILLLNKADLLTEEQRKLWAEYLTGRGFKFFFFSAFENLEEQAEKVKKLQAQGVDLEAYARAQEREAAKHYGADYVSSDEDDEEDLLEEEAIVKGTPAAPKPEPKKKRRNKKTLKGNAKQLEHHYDVYSKNAVSKEQMEKDRLAAAEAAALKKKKAEETEMERERDERVRLLKTHGDLKPWDVLSPEALLDQMALLREPMKITERNTPLMVGMVGYPNVGKSSTINAIIGSKKVVVSSTPGKTKHFQTLTIPNERRVMLCDCPGLVFPSFAATKNTMICDGVLPIDTVKDYVSPIGIIAQRIPQVVFERMYKIQIHKSLDVDDSTNDADLLLNFVARRKHYMTEHDKPYRAKAAKEILKMYVDGQLIYVHPPPGYEASEEMKSMYTKEIEAEEAEEKAAIEEARRMMAEAEEEEEEEEVFTDDGDEEWEDIDSASDARGISDDEDDMTGIRFAGQRKPKKEVEDDTLKPRTFLTRPDMTTSHILEDSEAQRERMALSRNEAFNLQSNLHLLKNDHVKKRQTKKRLNHQLEPDLQVMINEDGKKELLIDSDDGIVECDALPRQVIQRPKKPSKRQLRREEKKSMTRKTRLE